MSEIPQSESDSITFDKYLQTSRHLLKRVRQFDYKKFFQDILLFLSIIAAYFVVSLTYQFPQAFEGIININLKKSQTIPLLSFIFSLNLIFWNVVAYTLKKRALRPPQKKDQYQQAQKQQQKPIELPPLPNGEKYIHEIIYQSINQTIYLFLLLLSVGAYSYLNQPRRQDLGKLVNIERVNYIGIWFLAANLFYLIGSLFNKWTKMSEWKALGVAMRYIIGFLILGLANGYNTFIFI